MRTPLFILLQVIICPLILGQNLDDELANIYGYLTEEDRIWYLHGFDYSERSCKDSEKLIFNSDSTLKHYTCLDTTWLSSTKNWNLGHDQVDMQLTIGETTYQLKFLKDNNNRDKFKFRLKEVANGSNDKKIYTNEN